MSTPTKSAVLGQEKKAASPAPVWIDSRISTDEKVLERVESIFCPSPDKRKQPPPPSDGGADVSAVPDSAPTESMFSPRLFDDFVQIENADGDETDSIDGEEIGMLDDNEIKPGDPDMDELRCSVGGTLKDSAGISVPHKLALDKVKISSLSSAKLIRISEAENESDTSTPMNKTKEDESSQGEGEDDHVFHDNHHSNGHALSWTVSMAEYAMRRHLIGEHIEAGTLLEGGQKKEEHSDAGKKKEEEKGPEACHEVVHDTMIVNLDLYSDENQRKRKALQQRPELIGLVKVLWDVVEMVKDAHGHLTEAPYKEMIIKFHYLIVPHPIDLEQANKNAESDWKNDSQGKSFLDFPMFLRAIFQLADLWTYTCEFDEYREFLQHIIDGVTKVNESEGGENVGGENVGGENVGGENVADNEKKTRFNEGTPTTPTDTSYTNYYLKAARSFKANDDIKFDNFFKMSESDEIDLQDMTSIDEAGGRFIDGGADGEQGHDLPSGIGGAEGQKKFNWAQVATKVCVRSQLSKMLKNVRKRHHAVTLPMDKLLETIAKIFQAKSSADLQMEEVNRKRVQQFEANMEKYNKRKGMTSSGRRPSTKCPNVKRPKLPKLLYYKRFDKFILNYFKSLFGSLDIAKRQMHLLMVSVKSMAQDHPRVMLFARMAGLDIPGQLLISGHYYPYLTSEFLLPVLRKLSDKCTDEKVKGKRSLFQYLQQGIAENKHLQKNRIPCVEAKKENIMELLKPTFNNLPPDFSMVEEFYKFVATPAKDGGALCGKGKVDVERCLDRAAKLWERCVMFRSFTLHKAIRVLAKTNKLKKILYRIRERKAAEAAEASNGSAAKDDNLKEDGVATAPTEHPTMSAKEDGVASGPQEPPISKDPKEGEQPVDSTETANGKEDGVATAPQETVNDMKNVDNGAAVPNLNLGGDAASVTQTPSSGTEGGEETAVIFESPRVVQALADAKALDSKINVAAGAE